MQSQPFEFTIIKCAMNGAFGFPYRRFHSLLQSVLHNAVRKTTLHPIQQTICSACWSSESGAAAGPGTWTSAAWGRGASGAGPAAGLAGASAGHGAAGPEWAAVVAAATAGSSSRPRRERRRRGRGVALPRAPACRTGQAGRSLDRAYARSGTGQRTRRGRDGRRRHAGGASSSRGFRKGLALNIPGDFRRELHRQKGNRL